jgi:hypothetical protein
LHGLACAAHNDDSPSLPGAFAVPIPAVCPKCQGRFQAADDAAGRAVACPHCQSRVRLPAATQEGREPEPWFIGFASVLAYVWLGAGLLAALLNYAAVTQAAREAARLGGYPYEGPGWAPLGSLLAQALVVLTSSALLLIFADIARSLRVTASRRGP